MCFDDIINLKKSIVWLGIKSDLSGWLTKPSSRNKFCVKNVSKARLKRNMPLEIWIGYIYNLVVTLASQSSKRLFWYFSKYSHSRSTAIRHGYKLKQISKYKLTILWTIIADRYWGKSNPSVRSIVVIYTIGLMRLIALMDSILKCLWLKNLLFQMQYHPFIASFFLPSKNTREKFIFIWCTLNNNYFFK